MVERSIYLILILTSSCYYYRNPCYSETDTLHQGQLLKDWDELISSNSVFSLKFFGFHTTISPYLGIFYNENNKDKLKYRYQYDSYKKAVWVANRNNPIPDIYGNLMIDIHGKLSLLSSGGTVLDLFSPTLVLRNASVTLLDTGNLVLRELYADGSVKQVLWQSFDYPTDTLLPGMKLGVNLKTGHKSSLTSWASNELPAHGSFTLTIDPNGTGQLVILRRGNIHWKSGPWQNGQFKNSHLLSSSPSVRRYYISNETEQSFTYLTKTYDLLPSLKIYQDGFLRGSTLILNVLCSSTNEPGCAEENYDTSKCRKDNYFTLTDNYIYADEYVIAESYNLTLNDCQRICCGNCSCVAYAYTTENKAGCKTYGQIKYNPAEAPHHPYTDYYVIKHLGEKKMEKKTATKTIWIGCLSVTASVALLLSCYLAYKKLDVGEILQGLFMDKE